MTTQEFLELKEKIAQFQRARDRLDGQIKMMTDKIKEEFGCATPEEVQELISKKERELAQQEKKADSLIARFTKRYGKCIEDD